MTRSPRRGPLARRTMWRLSSRRFLAPLNKERLTEDGVRYLLADWEWYIPIGEPAERFANKQ